MKLTDELCDKAMMYRTIYGKTNLETAKIIGLGEGTVSRIGTVFNLVKAEAWEELEERMLDKRYNAFVLADKIDDFAELAKEKYLEAWNRRADDVA